MWFENIFFKSVTCLFFLLTVSFTEQSSVNFVEIPLTNIFSGLCFCFISQKSWPNPRSQNFSLILSSKKFILLTFHLDLSSILNYFLYMVWSTNSDCFLFLHVDIHLFHYRLLKNLFFLHWIVFIPLLKIKQPHMYVSISGLYFIPVDLHVFLFSDIKPSWLL